MKPLNGTPIQHLPVRRLELVRDLIVHDGPLLSHLRHPSGDHYLRYWVDCDSTVNRWMLLRVSETNILRLVNRIIPLDHVIPRRCLDDFVYFIDSNGSSDTRIIIQPVE